MKTSAARTRMVEGASRLFYEQGYQATGIAQIIGETKVARRSFYKHFPSKRDLLTAYISHSDEQWFKQLDEFLSPLITPREKILALADFRTERQLRSSYGGCQFIKVSAEIDKNDLDAFRLIAEQKKRFKAYIFNLLEQGEITAGPGLDRSLLAETIFLILEGGTVNAAIEKSIAPLQAAKKIIASLI